LISFPNPVKESTAINFSLPAASHTLLILYDITGKQVAVLVNGWLQAGNHRTTFTSHSISAGTYLLKLVYYGKIVTKKLLKE
jgi:hypothetical protein